jgi:putative transposase
VRATLRLKLHTDPATDAVLRETLRQSTACFNAICRYGWEAEERNSIRLHNATYWALRTSHPDLPSQLVISARMKAAETLKSVHERGKKGKPVSCPQSALSSIRYDARSYWVRLHDETASLATICGRRNITFRLPDCYHPYLDWNVCSADLCYDHRKRRFYLHVAVETESPPIEASGKVVGCDLGIRRVAVTSQPQFFSSKRLHTRTRQYQHLQSALQRKGTKSAKRHLRKVSRRWKRFQQAENHRIANTILSALSPGDTLVVEDLKDIRDRCKHRKATRGLFHRWSFAQLQDFLSYKAERKGVHLLAVEPYNTSRTCPKCGHCEPDNRLSQSEFKCRGCVYNANADYVAAQNLRQKGIASLSRLLSDSPSFPSEAQPRDEEQVLVSMHAPLTPEVSQVQGIQDIAPSNSQVGQESLPVPFYVKKVCYRHSK